MQPVHCRDLQQLKDLVAHPWLVWGAPSVDLNLCSYVSLLCGCLGFFWQEAPARSRGLLLSEKMLDVAPLNLGIFQFKGSS